MPIRAEDYYGEIFAIVRRFFSKAQVYLFGSRSRNEGRPGIGHWTLLLITTRRLIFLNCYA